MFVLPLLLFTRRLTLSSSSSSSSSLPSFLPSFRSTVVLLLPFRHEVTKERPPKQKRTGIESSPESRVPSPESSRRVRARVSMRLSNQDHFHKKKKRAQPHPHAHTHTQKSKITKSGCGLSNDERRITDPLLRSTPRSVSLCPLSRPRPSVRRSRSRRAGE